MDVTGTTAGDLSRYSLCQYTEIRLVTARNLSANKSDSFSIWSALYVQSVVLTSVFVSLACLSVLNNLWFISPNDNIMCEKTYLEREGEREMGVTKL